jgi:hypothetical protein
MFIFTTDQELCSRELMCRIMGCGHSLGLIEFLDQLNLLYICIYLYFVTDQELCAHKLMDRIMSCDHSLGRKKVLKFVYCFMNLFLTI